MLLYALYCLLVTTLMKGEAALIISPPGTICPGVVVNFTCRTASSFLRWTATLGDQSIDPVTFDSSIRSPVVRMLGTRYRFEAVLVHTTTSELISNLTLVAAIELNGLNVQCSHPGGHEVQVLHTVTGPPFTPIAASVASIRKEKFYVTLHLKWNDTINNSTTSYIVTVSTDLVSSTKWKSNQDTRTSAVLKVPYNINYTISVTAINCIGTETVVEIKGLNIVNCSTPPVSNGMLIEPYNDTTEGAVVYYSCAEGSSFSANRVKWNSTCGSNGRWSPSSPPVQDNTDCQSLVRNNGTSKVFDELEVTEKIFQCERGSGKFSAICTQDNTSGCTPLHVTSLNCNSCFHADTGLPFNISAKLLLGLASAAGFVGGAVIVCLLVVVFVIVIQRCRYHLRKNAVDMNDNVAYETVKIRSKSNQN